MIDWCFDTVAPPAVRRALARLLVLAAIGLAPGGMTAEPSPATGAPRVEIYTSASCVYCKALRVYLKARDIGYTEHNINATLESRDAFYAMGGVGTPLVVIDGQLIHGFDPMRIEAALDAEPAPSAKDIPTSR